MSSSYDFKRISPQSEDWDNIESCYDSTCYHSRYWAHYLERIGYAPFVLKVYKDNCHVGYFVGERIWRGVTLITAPFEGIGTYTQGLSMMMVVSEEERVDIYKSLSKWIFERHLASYLQIEDWNLRRDRKDWINESDWKHVILDEAGLDYEVRATLHVSLKKTEEELWSALHYKSCKYCVNKARKLGLYVKRIENFDEISGFLTVHFNQLREVCSKHGTKPKIAQSKSRMKALCESLFPNRVLMIEVIGKDETGVEQVMASGIFCIDKGESCYWTGASFQRFQRYCPNELMVWEAMRMMRELGAGDLNFCGMASYKLKFGTEYAYVPRIVCFKHRWIYKAKSMAKRMYYRLRCIMSKSK